MGDSRKKEIPTTKTTMGEGRIKILDKILKRGKYADKEINSANDYVKEDLKKKEKDLRCGGRVHKKAEGGMLKTPDNPGLKKLPESVRNNMGYMKKGGKVKKCKRDGIAMRGKTKAGR